MISDQWKEEILLFVNNEYTENLHKKNIYLIVSEIIEHFHSFLDIEDDEYENHELRYQLYILLEEHFNIIDDNHIEHIEQLYSVYNNNQKSENWLKQRSEMITASDIGSVLGKNKYSSKNDVLKNKLFGRTYFSNLATKHGELYEPIATYFYETIKNTHIYEFGCIPHSKFSFMGASPDGISTHFNLLEIKCPLSRKITIIPPEYYYQQVQMQLECIGLYKCDFLQCVIKEISYDEYKTSNNNKGIIENNTLLYFNNNNIQHKLHYIYFEITEYIITPIYKDPLWMNKYYQDIESFWKDVLFYRKYPELYKTQNNNLFI
jgi:putative phage-type endonuclease